MRTALIDADVLRYEIGAVGYNEEKEPLDFELVRKMFDDRIEQIREGSESDEVKLFITADKRTHDIAKRSGIVEGYFVPNFREALAKGKVYKGTRKQDKPFHWVNLTAYILSLPDVSVAIGYEADDAISIEHLLHPETSIICTRDKDLRMVPGLHYGWECGKQPEFGPVTYDNVGKIELVRRKSGNVIKGGGFAFFAAQLLTGDVVDNIGGLRGTGPVRAHELLSDCTTEREYFSAVQRHYQEVVGDSWKESLAEQASLLWIVRGRNEDGSLKHFNIEEWL